MREIKLRAWDGKKMIYKSSRREYDDYYTFDLDGTFYGHTRTGDEYFNYDTDWFNKEYPVFELMQFTGLKDKNGKEIYEGDIVKGCCFNGSYAIGKVVQSRTGWVVYPIGKFLEGYDDIDTLGIEIIGNIYENPESCI